jgi:tetratricopeptide (TPR) repeat protein
LGNVSHGLGTCPLAPPRCTTDQAVPSQLSAVKRISFNQAFRGPSTLFQGLRVAVLAEIRRAVLAAIRFASPWIPPLASWVRRSAEKYAERALESYQRGDRDQTVAYFREALEWLPLNAEFHSALGQVYYEQGRPGEAEEQFRKALDLNYRNLRALKGLGVVLHEKNELLDAMYLYLRYIEVEPKDAIVCYNLGVVFNNLGKYEDAVEWYGRRGARPREPDSAQEARRRAARPRAV